MAYPVVDVSEWTRGEPEPGGDEAKLWFRAPENSRYSGHWLMKPRKFKVAKVSKARLAAGESHGVLVGGQDWAEKIVYELALLLEIPAVTTELAILVEPTGVLRGSMSRDMRPHEWERSSGAQLLSERDVLFDASSGTGHTVTAIRDALSTFSVAGPAGTQYQSWSGFDVMVGYLLLDALVVNTDRHALNWAVLQAPSGALFLAPSFDHGSSLAAGAADEFRSKILDGERVDRWCRRPPTARQLRFEAPEGTTLLDIALEALAYANDAARWHWIKRFTTFDLRVWNDIVDRVPEMSDAARTFVKEAVHVNRIRISNVV